MMMGLRMRIMIQVCVLLSGIFMLTAGVAQEIKKVPYYISLNDANGATVRDISDKTLSLQYYDSYGRLKDIALSIYDWKRVLVATVSLDKAFGLNSYVIDLDNVYSDWKPRSLYTCELKDENNRKYVLPFRLVPPPETPGPDVSILVNPIEVSCEDVTSNVVEYYGSIDGGKAPYTVQWYIMNDSRTQFLYQPREEIITKAGKTTVISVDANPDYYVVMFVKDACGNLQQKVVNLTCEENRKKINSVFIEQLESPLINNVIGKAIR